MDYPDNDKVNAILDSQPLDPDTKFAEPSIHVTHTEAEDLNLPDDVFDHEGTGTIVDAQASLANPESQTFDIDDDALLRSLLGDMPVPTPMSAEEIQKRSDELEAVRNFNVEESAEDCYDAVKSLRDHIVETLDTINQHICKEWNKAVTTDDAAGSEFLVASEAPRWLAMARTDFQVALLKLDRVINKSSEL